MIQRQFVAELPYMCAVMNVVFINEPNITTRELLHNSMNFFTKKSQKELYVSYRALCDGDATSFSDALVALEQKYSSSLRVRLFVNALWLHFQGNFGELSHRLIAKLSKAFTDPSTQGEFYEYVSEIPMLLSDRALSVAELTSILLNMTKGNAMVETKTRRNVMELFVNFTGEGGDPDTASQNVFEKVKCGEELIFYMRLVHLLKKANEKKEETDDANRRRRKCVITKLRPDDETFECSN